MDQDEAINTLFALAEKAQSRGAWTLQEAHAIWEARDAFANPKPQDIPQPEIESNVEYEPNLDDTAAE